MSSINILRRKEHEDFQCSIYSTAFKSNHIDKFKKYLREQAGRIAEQKTNKEPLTLGATEVT